MMRINRNSNSEAANRNLLDLPENTSSSSTWLSKIQLTLSLMAYTCSCIHLVKYVARIIFFCPTSFNLSPDQGRFALPVFSVLNTVIADTCPPQGNCQPTKYRTVDGSCNNLANERWGRAGTALQRILPPKYEDGRSISLQISNSNIDYGLYSINGK